MLSITSCAKNNNVLGVNVSYTVVGACQTGFHVFRVNFFFPFSNRLYEPFIFFMVAITLSVDVPGDGESPFVNGFFKICSKKENSFDKEGRKGFNA